MNLMTVVDGASFEETTQILEVINPSAVYVPHTASQTVLVERVKEVMGAKMHAVKRSVFDDARARARFGMEAEFASGVSLMAAAAVLHVAAEEYFLAIPAEGMRIASSDPKFRRCIGISPESAVDMGLVGRNGLLEALDQTCTAVGRRRLSAQVLAPPSDRLVVEARLDAVEEVATRHHEPLVAIAAALKSLPDLYGLVRHFFARPARSKLSGGKSPPPRAPVRHVVELRGLLQKVSEVTTTLGTGGPALARLGRRIDADEGIVAISRALDEVLSPDTVWSRSPLHQRQEEVFAIRAGVDGTLDMLRSVYSDLVEQVARLADRYRDEWDLPSLQLHHNMHRGYHLVLRVAAHAGSKRPLSQVLHADRLPDLAIQKVQSSRHAPVYFTTAELAGLDRRIREALARIYKIADTILAPFRALVRSSHSSIGLLADTIAEADVIQSLATFVVSNPSSLPFTRPVFLDASSPALVDLVKARHPVVERSSTASSPFVPVSVAIGTEDGPDTLILAGANASGKSTLLRMVGTVTVLAHLGCLVPAESATFGGVHRISALFSRPTSSSPKSGVSFFLAAMRSTAAILHTADQHSVLLFDELGRGTSASDATGIAWALLEHLLHLSHSRVLFSTHCPVLPRLALEHDRVAAVTMGARRHTASAHGRLLPTFTLLPSHTPESAAALPPSYGLDLAEHTGLPTQLIDLARTLQ